MSNQINMALISHIGNSRSNNEDNFILPSKNYGFYTNENSKKLCECSATIANHFCCAVSDGMGGHEFGEVASLKVVEYLSIHYDELINSIHNKEAIRSQVARLNDHFCNFAARNKNYRNMGATLCGVVSDGKKALCFNVGDSRAYTFCSGKLKQITVDHSEGQRLFDLQLLTAEELKTFPNRKAIYKYIGQKTTLIPDIFEIENYSSCSYILLCTDGLTDVLSDDEIESILGSTDIDINRKSQLLIDLALKRRLNAGDNITLILIEL